MKRVCHPLYRFGDHWEEAKAPLDRVSSGGGGTHVSP